MTDDSKESAGSSMLDRMTNDVVEDRVDGRATPDLDHAVITVEDELKLENAFYFESDHAAIRGNKDYHNVLRTLARLETQRAQAVSDLETLLKCQDIALQDPIKFVQNLQSGVDLGLPKQIKVASIPTVPWEQYTTHPEQLKFGMKGKQINTRGKRVNVESLTPNSAGPPVTGSIHDAMLNPVVVRGRMMVGENKSKTFNQLWTAEEQKRLEELLVQFPPEEVEARRWQKIATALGNRTTAQVASRIQKYFIKLAKAGLPIPGRMPNIAPHLKRGSHRHQRNNKFYHPPSTFLSSYEPPVYMSDDDDDKSFSSFGTHSAKNNVELNISDDESVPVELRNSEEYREIMALKRARREKLCGDYSPEKIVQHTGYRCDRCDTEPIIGVRWHCQDCPTDQAPDLCEECIDCPFETASHNSSHRLMAIHRAQEDCSIDCDYTKFGRSYLDPNFMPAT